MIVSSNLSLIPYPPDNYRLKQLDPRVLIPSPDHGQNELSSYDLLRYLKSNTYFIHAGPCKNRYSPSRCMESSRIDQLGLVIDIYV